MKASGTAMMGIGTASGDNRATDAASEAISSRLLEGTIDGATRVLLSIAGNKDLGIQEINDAADLVAQNVDPDATIIFGTVVDESLGDQVRVTVIATGFNDANVQQPLPTMTMPSSRRSRACARSGSHPGPGSGALDADQRQPPPGELQQRVRHPRLPQAQPNLG